MSNSSDDATAMSKADNLLRVKGYEEIPLTEIGRYPMLAACHAAWLAAHHGNALPAAIEIEAVPREVIPYTMLLDYLPDQRDVRVRIAGNYVGERTTADMGGKRLHNFFNEHDAAIVYASMEQVANARQPSIARRSYVSLEGKFFSYVRLIMPLSLDGVAVTGFFKTIEPDTLATDASAGAVLD